MHIYTTMLPLVRWHKDQGQAQVFVATYVWLRCTTTRETRNGERQNKGRRLSVDVDMDGAERHIHTYIHVSFICVFIRAHLREQWERERRMGLWLEDTSDSAQYHGIQDRTT